MLLELWKTFIDYFKDKPYWSRIQPLFTLASLYIVALVLAYQFLEWQFHYSPPLSIYIRSYIVKQITVVVVGIAALLFLFSHSWGRSRDAREGRLSQLSTFLARSFRKLIASGIVLVFVIVLFRYLTPHSVSQIRVRFLDNEPDFDRATFVYILYELNRLQKKWYFVVDFNEFNKHELTSAEQKRLENGDEMTAAVLLAGDQPFIGITSRQIGEYHFWRNVGKVSVISTYGWKDFAPPSIYEFLAHAVIIQSLLIHLNANAGGLPQDAFVESRASSNDLFEFAPRRYAMKAEILAARLSPGTEQLIFNAFGAEYVSVCSELLRLDWLHSKQVADNLQNVFGAKLEGVPQEPKPGSSPAP